MTNLSSNVHDNIDIKKSYYSNLSSVYIYI